MGDSLPRTPLNHRANFDAVSFILAGFICNRTNMYTKTNKQSPIYPHLAYRHVWIKKKDAQSRPAVFVDITGQRKSISGHGDAVYVTTFAGREGHRSLFSHTLYTVL